MIQVSVLLDNYSMIGLSRFQSTQVHIAMEIPATYSVPQAGQLLGIGRNAAYEAARKGEIPTIRIGGRVLVPRAALERLLAEGRPVKPAA